MTRYTITTKRDDLTRVFEATDEAHALDIIDDCVGTRFAIVTVVEENGATIPTTELLDRLVKQSAPAEYVDGRDPDFV